MKAVAVYPGKANSAHLRDISKPEVSDVPNGRGVLVKVLKVGVDATDKEINEALYGDSPKGDDFLVIGHECFGVVVETGDYVNHVKPGDYVTCTVRRPGNSIYDKIGRSDITSQDVYYERGINLLHGYLTEYFVDDVEFVVKVPATLKHLHVLCEPMSVAAKAVEQAFLAQQRLHVWRPERAFVLGAGQIGLLATMILRLRGIEVYTFARSPMPCLKGEIAEQLGATYVSGKDESLQELVKRVGRADLIIESTGHSGVAFEAMGLLRQNGVLVWTSITGGEHTTEVPADKINLDWVLGNKLLVGTVNSNYEHFEKGISSMALGEAMYPGVQERILTNSVNGLENYEEMIRLLVEDKEALKVYVNVAEED